MIPFTTTNEAIRSISTNSLSLIVGIIFISFFMIKEIASSLDRTWAKRLNRALNVHFIPIVIAFIIILVAKAVEVLR